MGKIPTIEIDPPYGVENCHAPKENQVLIHVKKIVTKHLINISELQ